MTERVYPIDTVRGLPSDDGTNMTVAAYIRVSTRRQNDDGQRAEVKKWLDNNGIDPMKVEWYCDKESGTTLKRPEFDRLQADIFHGRVKTVVLWKLDRLSRRLKDGITTLAEWSEKNLWTVWRYMGRGQNQPVNTQRASN